MEAESFLESVLAMSMELMVSELNESVHAMKPLESGHRKPEVKAANVRPAISQSYNLAGVPIEKGTGGVSSGGKIESVFVLSTYWY